MVNHSAGQQAQRVHVLLATFNGERHLPQQWRSIEQQEGVQVVLHVADDASTDGTAVLLQQLAAAPGGAIHEVRWMHAPPRGCATRSFLQLLQQAVESEPHGMWFAFCDQDDVWLPGKLACALQALAHVPAQVPALYGGRTLCVDEEDRPWGLSPLFDRPPCFRNALVQSILGGNTIVLNRAAALLVAASAHADVTAHDWFCYQLVSGAGGTVVYDPRPFVRYRQHARNVVGSNLGWRARWRRLQRVLRGDFSDWNDRHLAALQARADTLAPTYRAVLEDFARARRDRNPLARLRWLRRSGVFRQPAGQQLALWVACLMRRM